MGFMAGSTFDFATLRAFRPTGPADIARRAVKPRRRFFSAR